MNERLKELIKQATEHDYTTWDSYNQKELVYYKFNQEKFADLIVQDVLNLFGDERLSLHYLEQPCCEDAMTLLQSKIMDHFGIKNDY